MKDFSEADIEAIEQLVDARDIEAASKEVEELHAADIAELFRKLNLASPGAGTYTVTLNLGQIPYSCTIVKK